MRLYEVPNATWCKFKDVTPEDEPFYFLEIDGMYSLCKDIRGGIFHLGASTEVEITKCPQLSDGMS